MKELKACVFKSLEVTDTKSMKKKAKELEIDMSGIDFRTKIGWETMIKRLNSKLNIAPMSELFVSATQPSQSSIPSDNKPQASSTQADVGNAVVDCDVTETIVDLSSVWQTQRAAIYTTMKGFMTASEIHPVIKELNGAARAVDIKYYNSILIDYALDEFTI